MHGPSLGSRLDLCRHIPRPGPLGLGSNHMGGHVIGHLRGQVIGHVRGHVINCPAPL